jgi:Tol biopolymer transport system component
MTHAPEVFVDIDAAASPAFSRDGQTLFYLRGSSLPQVWELDLTNGASRQLTFHDEKVALLRRSPIDDRLIHGIDRGGDERQQLLLLDPSASAAEPTPLTANPAVIHDFGGWSPDGKRIVYCANERDEAHFDVYVQEVANGERRRVYDGTNMVSAAGFRSDGAKLVLLLDRGFADISLVVLDLASGDVRTIGPTANYRSVRWASDGSISSTLISTRKIPGSSRRI